MTRIEELVAAIGPLDHAALEEWVSRRLVAAVRVDGTLCFDERACARVRLICSLRYEMEIEADALEVVLSLLDQLYETRAQLMALGAAVARQDAQTRAAILAAMPQPAGGSA